MAIERFVGKAYRPHSDLDISVLRDEAHLLQKSLSSWELYLADPPGSLQPWLPDGEIKGSVHDIWGFQKGAEAWQLQIMLQDASGSEWVFRRDPKVRGNLEDFSEKIHGMLTIRPEIQLLYKATGRLRDKDQLDFQECLPKLGRERIAWLLENLVQWDSGHPWISPLRRAGEVAQGVKSEG